jgi:hypothetical protein
MLLRTSGPTPCNAGKNRGRGRQGLARIRLYIRSISMTMTETVLPTFTLKGHF